MVKTVFVPSAEKPYYKTLAFVINGREDFNSETLASNIIDLHNEFHKMYPECPKPLEVSSFTYQKPEGLWLSEANIEKRMLTGTYYREICGCVLTRCGNEAKFHEAIYNYLVIKTVLKTGPSPFLLDYEAFTNILYDPANPTNTTAKAMAQLFGLLRMHKYECLTTFSEYIKIYN